MLLEALEAEELGADRVFAVPARAIPRVAQGTKERLRHAPPQSLVTLQQSQAPVDAQ